MASARAETIGPTLDVLRAQLALGDIVLIVAGRKSVVAASLGALRIEIAKRENLIPRGVYKPLWVTVYGAWS